MNIRPSSTLRVAVEPGLEQELDDYLAQANGSPTEAMGLVERDIAAFDLAMESELVIARRLGKVHVALAKLAGVTV